MIQTVVTFFAFVQEFFVRGGQLLGHTASFDDATDISSPIRVALLSLFLLMSAMVGDNGAFVNTFPRLYLAFCELVGECLDFCPGESAGVFGS